MVLALRIPAGLLMMLGFVTAWAQQAGLMPVPFLQNVQVQAGASLEAATQFYAFRYTVTNPAGNTGEIRAIHIDVSGGVQIHGTGLTIPMGSQNLPFDDLVSILAPLNPVFTLTFGLQVPSGWIGGMGARGFAAFATGTSRIAPGQTRSGFVLISPGLPTIREVELIPYWVFLVDSEDATTPEEEQRAAAIEDSLPFRTKTLGPSDVSPGSYAHWNLLRDDLNQSIQIGWVPDAALANSLVSQLASARQAQDASDGTTAKLRLQPLRDAVNQATPGQIRQEARDLMRLNVESLIANVPDTPIPFEPRVTLAPRDSNLPLNALAIVTASVTNLGDPTNPPIPDFPVSFQILEGPNAGLEFRGGTGNDGRVSFSYVGQQLGTDKINVIRGGEEDAVDVGSALVNWVGGPDLVIQRFFPPMIDAGPGQSIPVTEITGNIGNIPAGPSATGYFLSSSPTTLDLPLGGRAVPALNPGESSLSAVTLRLPDDLQPGTYFLGACADVDAVVGELDEENNCQPTQVVVAMRPSSNQGPDCSNARPSVSRLWPPNHKLVPVNVSGIIGDALTITVTRITQDEPVNGLGDGDTSPDGFGVGTPQAQVRAERSGTGNGRVYAITFRADNGNGGSCTATVNVVVPHDQGGSTVPIDDGQNFESTLP